MKKTVAIVTFLALLIAGGTAFHASGASKKRSSQTIPNGIYYIYPKPSTLFRLDNDGGRGVNGNNVHLWESNGKNNQKWKVENVRGGIIIRSMNNQNYVIDNSGNKTVSRNNIQIWEYNGTNAQLWIPKKVGKDLYVLRNAQNPHYVIDWGGELRNFGVVHLFEFYPNFDNQILRFVRVKDSGGGGQTSNAATVKYNINSNGSMKIENNCPYRVNVNFSVYGHYIDTFFGKTNIRSGHVALNAYQSTTIYFNPNSSKYSHYTGQVSFQRIY